MIGDAAARGKRSSTLKAGPEYKKKNSEGASHKHVPASPRKNSGGDHEGHGTAKKMHAGMKPFSPGTTDRQDKHKQRSVKVAEHNEPGDIVDQWCQGKRGSYK